MTDLDREEQEILEAFERSRLTRASDAEDIQRSHAGYAANKCPGISGKTPNATTEKAMAELDADKGKAFDDADELYRDLGI